MSHAAPRNAFDFLRVVAASAVLLSHAFALYGLPEPKVLNGQYLGGTAVKVFFAVSGYLVMQSWVNDPHLGRYLQRRALRIFPGLVVATLVVTFVIGPIGTEWGWARYLADDGPWRYLAGTISLKTSPGGLPGLFESNPLAGAANGSLWTLRYEVAMYFILAAVGMALWHLPKRLLVWATGALVVGFAYGFMWLHMQGRHAFDQGVPVLWRLEPWRFGYNFQTKDFFDLGVYFFVGAGLFFARHSLPMRLWIGAAVLLLASYVPSDAVQKLALWVGIPYAAIAFAMRAPVIFRDIKGLDYSYGIYIYAWPVQQLLSQWGLSRGEPLVLVLILSLISTVALAALSWHFVERPSLRFKPTRVPPVQAQAVAVDHG